VFEFRLALDVEGKAVLEAALGPLSAPAPVDGERDLRTSDQRRGEALVELVRRAVAAGESVPTSPKAQICVTIDWESLASAVRGAGTTLGGSDTGTLLAPETVRRLACNASILPLVLGTDGEIVDQGRQHRLFTPAQIRRLWLRDGGCTYPGCSMPPHWRTHITWSTGRTSDRQTWATRRSSASATTRPCTPAGLPGRLSRTRTASVQAPVLAQVTARGWSGT